RRQPGAGGATALSRRRRTRPARGGRLDDLPAAVLVGGTGREPRAALAGRAIRRRPALRIRRGSGRDGPTPLRLAAHPFGVPVPRLSLRCGAARAGGREDRAAGWRRDRTHRATGRGAPANVAGSAAVRRAHVGIAGQRIGPRRRGHRRAVAVQAAVPGRRGGRGRRPGRGLAAADRPQHWREGGRGPASGAIRSRTTGDGAERVRPSQWSGLNQLVYVQGGAHSALWTGRARDELRTAPDLTVSQAKLVSARRERLPGIGARLVV